MNYRMARYVYLGFMLTVVVTVLGCRDKDALKVKVRTDFSVGKDTSFVDGLNSGISNVRMKKKYAENLVEITFDFDTAKATSDQSESFGLLYRFYDAEGRPIGHEQVDPEMSYNIISARSSGSRRDGTVTHALDFVSVDPATLRTIDAATIGFLSRDQIRW
jgi:hypothetical protein